jgi:Ni,Fe-hydrogenase maturation factor
MKISVFGNPLVEEDSLPLRILPKLKKCFPDIEFVVEDPTETLNPAKDEWWILDSALGIDEVKLIDDLSKLDLTKRVSVHDYDLSIDLKLLKKIGKLNKVKIIAVPVGMEEKEAFERVREILQNG